MKYLFQCPECKEKRMVVLPIEKRNTPQFCTHEGLDCFEVSVFKMERVFGRFYFTADRAVDKPENQALRVITRSGDPSDWAAEERRQVARHEAAEAALEPVPQGKSMAEIDLQGAWTAAHAGPDQLARWRKDNIPEDDFATT